MPDERPTEAETAEFMARVEAALANIAWTDTLPRGGEVAVYELNTSDEEDNE